MGKESKKKVDICITDSLCFTPQTNIVNQLYSNKLFLKYSATFFKELIKSVVKLTIRQLSCIIKISAYQKRK